MSSVFLLVVLTGQTAEDMRDAWRVVGVFSSYEAAERDRPRWGWRDAQIQEWQVQG